MDTKLLMIGLAAVLGGGAAIAAYNGLRDDFAQVVEVTPVMESREAFAEVVEATPVKEVVSVPRKICNDVAVQRRLPERDGNAGGAIAGALIGGLIGNQVGGGDGRKLATVAGAVAGGYTGREVDRRHVGGRVVAGTEQRCQTISEAREQVVGYEVSYVAEDGQRGELRTDKQPGEHVSLGMRDAVVGYDVTYRYRDVQRQVRMEQDPGDRLPVVDGKVVLSTDAPLASAGADPDRS
jgi:uncharacterized protein YcfJ